MRARITFLIALLALGAEGAAGAALDHWTYRTSGVSGFAQFSAISYGNGKFVVAGQAAGNVLLNSEDGVAWTRPAHGPLPQIAELAYGNRMFMGAGRFREVVMSTNGESWTSVTISNAALFFYTVAYGNGMFVVGGELDTGDATYVATIYSSTDGMNWSNWTSRSISNLRDVAFGNGKFVALGSGFNRGTPDRRVLVSSNGLDWTSHDAGGSRNWRGVTYGNDQFVAMADGPGGGLVAVISPDGKGWTAYPVAATNHFVTRLGFGNGTYAAVGSVNQSQHFLLLSTNGTAWESKYIGPRMGNYFLYDIAFGEGTFVVVGAPNSIAQSASVTPAWFERVHRSPTETELEISGEVGRGYDLQYSLDLAQWHGVLRYTNGCPTERVIDSAGADTRRFYRALTD